MPASFQTINQPQPTAGAKFIQPSPAVDVGGEEAVQAAALGASVFSQAAVFQNKKAVAEDKRTTATALGGLQQKLLNIRQAGATSEGIDVTREQRLALTQFNIDFPELRTEASAAFKAETGTAPAALDPVEKAELESKNESIKLGFGRFGADSEFNQEQHELRLNLQMQDKILASKIKAMDVAQQEGKINKAAFKATVLSGFQGVGSATFAKVASDSKNIISSVNDGTLSQEEAMLTIRTQRINLNRDIASLGEFSTDPAIQAYVKPILDQLQLTEDIVTGKIERDAAKNVIDTNMSRAETIFFSIPENINAVTVAKAFNYIPGLTTKASEGAWAFLVSGLTKEGMVPPSRAKPMDSTSVDKEDRAAVKEVLLKMSTDPTADADTKRELANDMEGIAEHLNRNGMDYDAEDKKFAVELLSTPGAMKLLNREQKVVVMDALANYVIDDVDVAMREISNAPIHTAQGSFETSRFLIGDPGKTQPVTEVAILSVQDGRIFWVTKPEFSTNTRVQKDIRGLNRRISEDITPTVSVFSEVTGVGFEQMAGTMFLPKQEQEVQEEPVKK